MHKIELHFCTLKNLSEKEIKKTVPFIIALKKIKYLGINLTKEIQGLYTENYKTLLKKLKTQMKKQPMIIV